MYLLQESVVAMAKFKVTMRVAIEVPDKYIETLEDTMRFINEEISLGPVEGMKKLEDGDLGRMLKMYYYTVEHLEES